MGANAELDVNATATPASAASVSILYNYYIDPMFTQYDTVNNDKTKHNFFTLRKKDQCFQTQLNIHQNFG